MKSRIKVFLGRHGIRIAAIALALGIVLYFVNIIVFQRKEMVLSVLILSEEDSVDIGILEKGIRRELDAESEKKDVEILFLDVSMEANRAILLTRVRARTVDIIISEPDIYRMAASGGMCMDLKEALPISAYDAVRRDLCMGAVSVFDGAGQVADTGQEKEFGLDLTESAVLMQCNRSLTEPVASVVTNSERVDNAITCLMYLWGAGSAEALHVFADGW